MEVLDFGGKINLAMIAGIIGLLLTVKRLDTKNMIGKKLYVIAVVLLGFIAGIFVSDTWFWKEIVANGIIHAGAASILYQTGKMAIPTESRLFNGGKHGKAKKGMDMD